MAYINILDIKKEVVNFLRNLDVISISDRGVTTVASETFSGDTVETEFTLAQTIVKNVRIVTIGAATQTFGEDYTIDYTGNKVVFGTPPASGTDNIDISYDYGASDSIFPDFPQPFLKVSDFPRISADIIGGNSQISEIGGTAIRTSYLMSVIFYDVDQNNIEGMYDTVRQAINENKKSFYYVDYISPIGIGARIVSPFGEQKVLQRNLDFEVFIADEN